MENAKIYGLCLERLKHQIRNARTKAGSGRMLIECYCSAEAEDIIDIMELYDIEERSDEALTDKLEDLAFTVSVLLKETLSFGRDGRGQWGLYLVLPDSASSPSEPELAAAAA